MASVARPTYRSAAPTRSIPLGVLASRLLLIAFTLSVAYQVYRAMVKEVPAYDNFDLFTGVSYAVFIGLSLLAGVRKSWAPWLTLTMSICFTLIGILYYYPTITPLRSFGVIDWTEGLLFSGLILAAGVLSVCELLGLTLSAE